MRRAGSAVTAGACAAAAARLAYAVMNRRPPGGPKAWSRTNHRGEPVTLLEGPAVAAGAIAGVLAQAALAPATSGSAGRRRAAAIRRSALLESRLARRSARSLREWRSCWASSR